MKCSRLPPTGGGADLTNAIILNRRTRAGGSMTPLGQNFVLRLGPGESSLKKLLQLCSHRLFPVQSFRKDRDLFVTLSSPVSTQSVADGVGPGVQVEVSREEPEWRDEGPPGTDWMIRVVGDRYRVERSLEGFLKSLWSVSKETGSGDIVWLRINLGEPGLLDMRVSTQRQTEFATQRRVFLDLGEKLGLGVLVQPLVLFKKPKGLVCFDLDSTLVREELIIEVAKVAGREVDVERITKEAMAGNLDYDRSFIQRVALLRGVKEEDLERIWEGINPPKEITGLLTSLRFQGIRTAIISGAFSFFTERARERLGVDFSVGNQVEIKNGRLTGVVLGEIVNAKVKRRKMAEFAERLNLTLDRVVAVGDGANDIWLVRDAGTGIAYNKGGLVKAYADGVLPDGQLANLSYLLG